MHIVETRAPVRCTFGQCSTFDDVLDDSLARVTNGEEYWRVRRSRRYIPEINGKPEDGPLVCNRARLSSVAGVPELSVCNESTSNNGVRAGLPSQTGDLDERERLLGTGYFWGARHLLGGEMDSASCET